LNAYRLAQHQVVGIVPFRSPPDQAERIISAYNEAANELSSHVSAAVRLQRGEQFSNGVEEEAVMGSPDETLRNYADQLERECGECVLNREALQACLSQLLDRLALLKAPLMLLCT
jgi:hypothetical protein